MRNTRRPPALPATGTVYDVFAVCIDGPHRPLAGPALRPVGLALLHPDRSISAWLDAVPASGSLLLRPRLPALPLQPGCPAGCRDVPSDPAPVPGASTTTAQLS